MTTSSNLKNLTLIGKLSITNWEAKKKAKGIERDAEAHAGAKLGTISARKSLLPGAEKLDDIIKHSSAMRTWWNEVSAPWFDNGMRIYGIAGHIEIQSAFGDMARYRDQLINEFLTEYPALREQARFDLNDLFNEADYPTAEEVRRRFTCNFEVMPLPDVADFRTVQGIDSEELTRLTQEAEARANERVAEATRTAITRLHEAVKTMSDRLNQYTANEDEDKKGNRFYDSWVGNVQDLARIMPQLNITNNPKLAALAIEAGKIAEGTPDTFRFGRDTRKAAAAKAAKIADQLAGLFD